MSVTTVKDKRTGRVYYSVCVYERAQPGERPKARRKRLADKVEAVTLEQQWLNERDNPTATPPAADTFGAFAELYMDVKATEVSAATLRNYRQYVNRLVPSRAKATDGVLLPPLGARKLSEITAMELRQIVGAMPLQPVTKRHLIVFLRGLLRAAIGEKLLSTNPADGLRTEDPARSAEVVPLTAEQQGWLLDAVKGSDVYAATVLLLNSGLRPQEAMALRWGRDVDEHRPAIRVREAVQQTSGGATVGETKTPGSKRRVPVAADVIDVLREYRDTIVTPRAKEWADSGAWVSTEYDALIFPKMVKDETGVHWAPWGPQTFAKSWKRALAAGNRRRRKAGLPTVPDSTYLYQTRHTFASMHIHHGTNVVALSRLLGHVNTSLTLNVYSHLLPGAESEALPAAL